MLERIRKAMEKRDDGFTLIELLVVMIIIGILAAISIPLFLSQKNKAYETSLKSDLTNIATNIATAEVDTPATIALSGGTGVNDPLVIESQDSSGAKIQDYPVSVSAGNSIVSVGTGSAVDAATGAYCIEEQHGAKLTTWTVSSNGTSGQKLAAGTCSSGVYAAPTAG